MSQQTHSQGSQNRPGQMTAVMRAVAPTGPKVLRIGLVQDGRVIEERIIRQRQSVTVGPGEKNLFVIGSTTIKGSLKLFEVKDGRYYLNFDKSMSGRVALPTGISDLSVLEGQARKTSTGFSTGLTEDSRGKVVIGETTFLFQFVAPPPVQPKPQLPVSVTRGATGLDWATTMIAAFSFLAHFMGLGALYSDWLDPVEDYEVNVRSLVESVKSLPAPPPLEQKSEQDEDEAKEKEPEKKAETKPKATPKKVKAAPKKPAPSTGNEAKPSMSKSEVAALATELDSISMGTLGFSGGKSATADVLRSGEVATGVLDDAAKNSAGVGAGSPGNLKLPSGGGGIRPGSKTDLASIGSSGKTAASGSGKTAKVQGPRGRASVGGASVAGGKVGNASSVVARMRAGFRACYNRALQTNPDISGRADLRIKVGPGGEVQGVAARKSGTLPASVVSCLKARARRARFQPPQGGTAVVSVPVTFVKQ